MGAILMAIADYDGAVNIISSVAFMDWRDSMEEKSVSRALNGYRAAAKAARAFKIAHGVALGCAAAALAVGGIRAVRRMREDG